MQHFALIWDQLDETQKQIYLKNADKKAKKLLQKQKRYTGVAILGNPFECLKSDPKIQGELLKQFILNGEALARAALAAEFTVLIVCQVPCKQQHEYTGRSQYPKFKRKTQQLMTKGNDDQSDLLVDWSELKNVMLVLRECFINGSMEGMWGFLDPLKAMVSYAYLHLGQLSDELRCEALALCKLMEHVDFNIVSVSGMTETVKKYIKQL